MEIFGNRKVRIFSCRWYLVSSRSPVWPDSRAESCTTRRRSFSSQRRMTPLKRVWIRWSALLRPTESAQMVSSQGFISRLHLKVSSQGFSRFHLKVSPQGFILYLKASSQDFISRLHMTNRYLNKNPIWSLHAHPTFCYLCCLLFYLFLKGIHYQDLHSLVSNKRSVLADISRSRYLTRSFLPNPLADILFANSARNDTLLGSRGCLDPGGFCYRPDIASPPNTGSFLWYSTDKLLILLVPGFLVDALVACARFQLEILVRPAFFAEAIASRPWRASGWWLLQSYASFTGTWTKLNSLHAPDETMLWCFPSVNLTKLEDEYSLSNSKKVSIAM